MVITIVIDKAEHILSIQIQSNQTKHHLLCKTKASGKFSESPILEFEIIFISLTVALFCLSICIRQCFPRLSSVFLYIFFFFAVKEVYSLLFSRNVSSFKI